MLLSRYPLESVQVHDLGGIKEPRSLLTAEVRLGGERVTVATTHLGLTAADRQRQLPRLESALQSVRTPLVLMGDFNSGLQDPQLAACIRELRLSPFPLRTPGPTVRSGGEIDHILTNLPEEGKCWTEPTRASDHLPVLGSLMLTTPAAAERA